MVGTKQKHVSLEESYHSQDLHGFAFSLFQIFKNSVLCQYLQNPDKQSVATKPSILYKRFENLDLTGYKNN